MNIKGGYTNYGQDIGILMLDTVFPRILGDSGNARTFSFPVRYHVVNNMFAGAPLPMDANDVLLSAFIAAAKSLEKEGCKAITTTCGFLAGFQKELADAVSIPVFTSVLQLVPFIYSMLGSKKEIAIFTERGSLMNETLYEKCGWSSKDIPVCVTSLPDDSPYRQLITYDSEEGNYDSIKDSIREMALRHKESHPNTGAIILECQNFAPFGSIIQEICNVPVFGINQLIEYIDSCVNYPFY